MQEKKPLNTLSEEELMLLQDYSWESTIQNFMNHMQVYNAGIKEIKTKLEILDEEFRTRYDYNPIHHIESRLKSPKSILGKIRAKGLSMTYESIRENITDIAGVRVICNYIDDIYRVADLLIGQDDVQLVRVRDYIKTPKPSGYRSLHLIVKIPIFLAESTELVAVEIQIRTIAMDFWASLEHKLKYKTGNIVSEELRERLKLCADSISSIDQEMQSIHTTLQQQQ